jgi:hypothetical protein
MAELAAYEARGYGEEEGAGGSEHLVVELKQHKRHYRDAYEQLEEVKQESRCVGGFVGGWLWWGRKEPCDSVVCGQCVDGVSMLTSACMGGGAMSQEAGLCHGWWGCAMGGGAE